jgi:hypothetical protein
VKRVEEGAPHSRKRRENSINPMVVYEAEIKEKRDEKKSKKRRKCECFILKSNRLDKHLK